MADKIIISNLWGKCNFFCETHQTSMEIVPGRKGALYYKCPVHGCRNQVSEYDVEDNILATLAQKLFDYEISGVVADMTNETWKNKGIKCRVLKHSQSGYDIAVYNEKEFKK